MTSQPSSSIIQLFLPLIIIIVAFFVGIISDKLIHSKLTKIAAQTKWSGNAIIIKALHRMFIWWVLLAGIIIALPYLPENYQHLIKVFHKTIVAIIIFSAIIVISKIAVEFIRLYAEKTNNAMHTTSIFANITKLAVFGIGILIILQTLGISIAPILTGLGIGGIAVALALQDILSNLFAGVHIIVSRQISVGDYIKLNTGEEGCIQDIAWRNTIIQQSSNNTIIIPNSKLASASVIKYCLQEIAVPVQVGVSYANNLEKVEKVTIEVGKEVMKEVHGGIPEFEPFIRYHTFADSSINFSVTLKGREFVDQCMIKHEFIKRLHKRYQEEKIVIPFPIRTVYMQQEGDNT